MSALKKEDRKDRGIRAAKRPPEPKKTLQQTHTAFFEAFQARKAKQWEFYGPIIVALLGAPDERLPAIECLEKVYEIMEDRLSEADHEIKTNQEPRWKAVARFAIMDLKEHGYIDSNAPRGIWALS